MYVEITRDAFRALVAPDTLCDSVSEKESYRITRYKVHGITVERIDHFVSCVVTYLLFDINA